MGNQNLSNNDIEKYLENFHEEKFAACDFMTLFCVIYAIQQNYSFSRDNLLRYIINCKKELKFENILQDIRLKNNGVYYYSDDFTEAISKLKISGILYTISPENDSSIYIHDDVSISNMIKPRINYIDEMVTFVSFYNKYEAEAINRVHCQIVNQESNDIERTVSNLSRVMNKNK